jgi:hypothetical protein
VCQKKKYICHIFYKHKILEIMNNPFAIRKSPVEMIAAQAIALDDYVKLIPRGGKKNLCQGV